MNAQRSISEALRVRQRELGETDGPFAKRLGVDRETWRKIRVGSAEPTRRTLQGAAAAFPDMVPEILRLFLPANASQISISESKIAEPEEVTA